MRSDMRGEQLTHRPFALRTGLSRPLFLRGGELFLAPTGAVSPVLVRVASQREASLCAEQRGTIVAALKTRRRVPSTTLLSDPQVGATQVMSEVVVTNVIVEERSVE
jgi:hypothetical protein